MENSMRSDTLTWRPVYDLILSLYEVGSLEKVHLWVDGVHEPLVEIYIKNFSISSKLVYCIVPASVAKLAEKLSDKLPKELIRGAC